SADAFRFQADLSRRIGAGHRRDRGADQAVLAAVPSTDRDRARPPRRAARLRAAVRRAFDRVRMSALLRGLSHRFQSRHRRRHELRSATRRYAARVEAVGLAERQVHARLALLPQGWARDVTLTIDRRGYFTDVRIGDREGPAGSVPTTDASGIVLPGMVNAHSHAFQRAMLGL